MEWLPGVEQTLNCILFSVEIVSVAQYEVKSIKLSPKPGIGMCLAIYTGLLLSPHGTNTDTDT